MNKLNIMIVGVGGQGTLLTGRVLGKVAVKSGYDVKVSEVHGMTQRGGSVVTYVKMGEKVFSPMVEKGEADVVMAFEKLEALRWAGYLKQGGELIVNDQRVDPMPVMTGKACYPADIIDKLKAGGIKVQSIDALGIAGECGNKKVVNVVLLGLLAKSAGIDREVWLEALGETVPPKLLEVNLKAFDIGYNYGRS